MKKSALLLAIPMTLLPMNKAGIVSEHPWLWFWLTIALIGVIIAMALARYLSKPRKKMERESIQSLELRKKLLVDALKTLEKEHDEGKIPDSYYESIKGDFKKQAVGVLKELDEKKNKKKKGKRKKEIKRRKK